MWEQCQPLTPINWEDYSVIISFRHSVSSNDRAIKEGRWEEGREGGEGKKAYIDCRSAYSKSWKVLNIIIVEIFSNYFSISQSKYIICQFCWMLVGVTGKTVGVIGLISLESTEVNKI